MNSGLVVITAGIAVGGAEAHSILTDKKGFQGSPVVGGFILGIFLYAFGMVQPGLTQKLCILIIIGSLLVNGDPLIRALTGPDKTANTSTQRGKFNERQSV